MKKLLLLSLALVTLLTTAAACNLPAKNISPEAAKTKMEKFINENLMPAGSKVTIDKVSEENGLYKLSVNLGSGQNIDSYLTKDGSKFFTQAIDVAQIEAQAKATSTPGTTATNNAPKSDKPEVELFVMSYCPYGTQIEKGILPVVEALGSKINYSLKFVDYAMHGEKELTENMTQYCIMKDQGSKFNTYLKCFLTASDSAGCLSSAGVDAAKVKTCVASTDKKYAVISNFNDTGKKNWKGSYPPFDIYKDDNTKYNVGGSPTLIINGTEVQSDRSPDALLKTICATFNTAPSECNATLSTDTPAAGFGTGTATTGTGTNAGCATN